MLKILMLLFVFVFVGCRVKTTDELPEEFKTPKEINEELFTYEEVFIIATIIDNQYEKFLTTEHVTFWARDPKTNELVEIHIFKNAPFYLKSPRDITELEQEHVDEIERNRPEIEEFDMRKIVKK